MVYKILSIFCMFFTFSYASINIKNLKTFQADFVQNIKSNTGKKIEYKGKVYIKNTGKILWRYKTPIEKNVYVLNNFAIVDEPELEQAIYTELENEINIIKILQTAKKVKKNIYKASIDKVDYFIEFKENKIEKIKYKDKLENDVFISFNNSVLNSNIKDSLFKFTAPKYYDIIRK